MNLKQLREECWDLGRDYATVDSDRLWRASEMNRYINRVYRRIARECQCIKDSTTPAVCLITVAPIDYTTYPPGSLDYIFANDPENWLYHLDVAPYLLTLHTSIVQIDEVKWEKTPLPLHKVSSSKWKKQNPWWERVIGLPTEYALDLESGKLALNFRRTETDTLRLAVRRLPLAELIDDNDIPEIKISYHDFMINGIMEQMYSKRDAETFDKTKADEFSEKFLLDIDEIKQQESQMEEHLRPNGVNGAFL